MAKQDNDLRFTQNFLKSKALVDKLVQQSAIKAGDTVLEIGPGKGIITQALAEQVTPTGRVIAVELDDALFKALQQHFRTVPQVELRQQDILSYPLEGLNGDYQVFSNVPFNITSQLLEWLLNPHSGPIQAQLILQREALIERNRAGYITETFKSLLIKPFYIVDVVHEFDRLDFVPPPQVETALFAFARRETPLINPSRYAQYKDFLAFVSKDRVGEGVWLKLFSKAQLRTLAEQHDLVYSRGLKSQRIEAIAATFKHFTALDEPIQKRVQGAMDQLREEQKRRERINKAGGHHRSKARSRKKKR